MYALIMFVLVFMSVFAAVFEAQAPAVADDTRAGYDLVVDSNPTNPLTTVLLQAQRDVVASAPLVWGLAEFETPSRRRLVPAPHQRLRPVVAGAGRAGVVVAPAAVRQRRSDVARRAVVARPRDRAERLLEGRWRTTELDSDHRRHDHADRPCGR